LFFEEQTADSLAETLKNFDPEKFRLAAISKSAQKFATKNFSTNLQNFIDKL
jgi:hypothetical protein